MPRTLRTNEEILRKLRNGEVYHHRRCREYFFDHGILTLPLSLPIPHVDLEQIQDSCNKSIAIYSITPHLEAHTEAYSRDSASRSKMIFSLYERWFRDHQSDVDFGNFVTKLIRVEIPSIDTKPTVGDITMIHKAWCEHVEINLPLCSRKTDSTGTEIDDPSFEFHGCIGIDRKQNKYYKLKSLFRALIMIVDHHASSDTEQVVHLFGTGLSSGLSAPITFESISPKLESEKSLGDHNNGLVTTTLSAAMDFVTALELREEKAFPESQRDSSIVDMRGADPGYHTRVARSMGYTGPEIRRASSTWVKPAEGEVVLSPLTPGVTRMKHRVGMTDQDIIARHW